MEFFGIDADAGVICTAVATASDTAPVRFVACDPDPAVIVKLPLPTLWASPLESIVNTLEGAAFHGIVLVTSAVVPSLYVAIAVNCSVFPKGIDGFEGVIAMEVMTAGPTVSVT